MSKSFTVEEVKSHNKENDLYLIIDNGVYDMSDFADSHPGGKKILVRNAGKIPSACPKATCSLC